jgi:hypothetical protein
MADAATRLRCGSSAIVRRCAAVTTGTCAAPGEVAHTLWTEVCASHNRDNSPGTAGRRRHATRIGTGRAIGSSGRAPRHDLGHFAPHSYCPRSFPRRRIVPVSRRPRNVIPGEWAAVRVTAGCHGSASTVAGVPAGPGGERMPTVYARKSPRAASALPTAGSHCLNGLPVHRSIAVAGRRGQANGGEPAVRVGNKTQWPAFMAASRSRRGGRHLIPSRVFVKGHTGTLRARAGYCPEVATPACRPGRGQPSGRLGQFQHAAKRLGRRRFGECRPGACDSIAGIRRGACVSYRAGCGPAFGADLASLQYQRMSAHAWPPSGTSKASGSAMPHMAHSAASSGRSSRRAAAGGSATAGSGPAGCCSGLVSCDVLTADEACGAMTPHGEHGSPGPGLMTRARGDRS